MYIPLTINFAKDFKSGLIIIAIKPALVFINDNTVHILLNAHVINYIVQFYPYNFILN